MVFPKKLEREFGLSWPSTELKKTTPNELNFQLKCKHNSW